MAQSRFWCFTVNNPEGNINVDLQGKVRYAVWQHEVGEAGTEHYQGYLELNRTRRLAFVKKILPDAHFEVRRGTAEQAIAYCKKDEGRLDGPWEIGERVQQGQRNDIRAFHNSIVLGKTNRELMEEHTTEYYKYQRLIKHVRTEYAPASDIPNIELRPWQQDLLERFRQPPVKRQIIWIWSTEGATGKTTFMDYVSYHFKVLPGSWKNDDNLYAYDGHQIVYWNIARAKETHPRMWEILELWSDHTQQLSGKYESATVRPIAHVVVTANISPPDFTLMSQDRFLEIRVPPL